MINPFQKLLHIMQQNYQQKHLRDIEFLAMSTVQIREFRGEVWIAFNSTPIVPVSALKDDLIITLNNAREAYVETHTNDNI